MEKVIFTDPDTKEKIELEGNNIKLILSTSDEMTGYKFLAGFLSKKNKRVPLEEDNYMTLKTVRRITQQTTQEVTRATTQAVATSASDGNEVRVVIKDVYYGTQAADILYDAGLITDKNEFVQYLISTGYGTKIQEGVYSIPKGSSYEAICQAISRK